MKPETLLSLHKHKDTKDTKEIEKKLTAGARPLESFLNGTVGLKIWRIHDENREGVKVIFKNPRRLTVFESALLYSFFSGYRPRDYQQYHKSVAGKKFFDSIESITFLHKVTKIVEGETIIGG